ncbi:hypothetical protein JO972_08715 [Verrucomicrobiaceae bacterium 5K15]|nr:hypothetical protein [Oceaniferula flavus]
MKCNHILTAVIAGGILLSGLADGAETKLRKTRDRAPETSTELTTVGEKLEAQYTEILNSLKAEIMRQLPTIDSSKETAFLSALQDETKALKHAILKAKDLRICRAKDGKLIEAQDKLEEAPKRVVDAQARLNRALAMPEGSDDKAKTVNWFKGKLEKRQADVKKLKGSVKKAEDALKKARLKEPELAKKSENATKVYEQAKLNTWQTVEALGLHRLASKSQFDDNLVKYTVLSEATPRYLAEFAQQGQAQEKLINQLLSNNKLMLQMLLADGAWWGKYGEAMEIYTAIQNISPKAKEGIYQRLALAVSLEHAVPLLQRNAKAKKDAPKYVDPVKRYLSYEKSYEQGELDPAFKNLSVWELRKVVDGKDPDDVFAWGRELLQNYRPSHLNIDYSAGRYAKAVDTEIFYGSDHVKDDLPELEFFQNVLANGGICGRRAFFGRFLLRAYGIPTTARREPGHATLAHWTPNGWETRLGGQWSGRASMDRYGYDMDFLANTQARNDAEGFKIVKRLQWIGDLVQETPVYGYYSKREPNLWYGLSLVVQRRVIESLKVNTPEFVGTPPERAMKASVSNVIGTVDIPQSEREIRVDGEGVITIPASACSKPANNTDVITFVESCLGGMQMHYSRYGGSDTFEYEFEVTKAGKYLLSAKLITPAWKQFLFVNSNGSEKTTEMALPYTVGKWGDSEPVEIELLKGTNVLTFSRAHYFQKGITIKEFKLSPVNQTFRKQISF